MIKGDRSVEPSSTIIISKLIPLGRGASRNNSNNAGSGQLFLVEEDQDGEESYRVTECCRWCWDVAVWEYSSALSYMFCHLVAYQHMILG
jgi:hypothetical protein